jgi:hypothetical protein
LAQSRSQCAIELWDFNKATAGTIEGSELQRRLAKEDAIDACLARSLVLLST